MEDKDQGQDVGILPFQALEELIALSNVGDICLTAIYVSDLFLKDFVKALFATCTVKDEGGETPTMEAFTESFKIDPNQFRGIPLIWKGNLEEYVIGVATRVDAKPLSIN